MAGTISIGILFSPMNKLFFGIILIEIIIIGLNIIYCQSSMFPNVIGADPWNHQMFTNIILKTGRIPEGLQYSELPLFHLEIGSASLMYNLNYKLSTLLSSDLILIIMDTIFIFLLGKFLFSEKVGLLAGLFLITANHQIYMLIYTIPNTIAAIFIIPIIYLMLKFYNNKNNITFTIIIFIFMFSIILTHTIVAMALAITLLVGWLSFRFYKNIFKDESKNYIHLPIMILFIVGMFAWWTYVSGSLVQFSIALSRGFTASKIILQYAVSINFTEELFNQIGMFIFFSFSLIGIFFMISKKFGDAKKFIFASMGFIILLLAFVPILTGQNLIQHRWFYFSEILLAIPMALTISIFIDIIKNKKIKSIFLFLFCTLLVFFMIISQASMVDSPTFSPGNRIRNGLFESEITAASFFSKKTISNIYSDFFYSTNPSSSVLGNYYNVNYSRIKSLDGYLEKGDFKNINGTIIIRDEISKKPFDSLGIIIKLPYNIYNILYNQGFSKIYSCESVNGYYK
jgi:hypothetical protein